jgi:hypothetical protein
MNNPYTDFHQQRVPTNKYAHRVTDGHMHIKKDHTKAFPYTL